jgi:hypothetical protein
MIALMLWPAPLEARQLAFAEAEAILVGGVCDDAFAQAPPFQATPGLAADVVCAASASPAIGRHSVRAGAGHPGCVPAARRKQCPQDGLDIRPDA